MSQTVALILYSIISVGVLAYSIYMSQPKASRSDRLLKKLNKAIKNKKQSFEYPVGDFLTQDTKRIINVLTSNKIKYSMYSKYDLMPTLMIFIRPGQGLINVNDYSTNRTHPAKPKHLKLLSNSVEDTNVINVNFQSKQRV